MVCECCPFSVGRTEQNSPTHEFLKQSFFIIYHGHVNHQPDSAYTSSSQRVIPPAPTILLVLGISIRTKLEQWTVKVMSGPNLAAKRSCAYFFQASISVCCVSYEFFSMDERVIIFLFFSLFWFGLVLSYFNPCWWINAKSCSYINIWFVNTFCWYTELNDPTVLFLTIQFCICQKS